MIVSTNIDRLTLGYVGQTPVNDWHPAPKGLRSTFNRAARLSWHKTEAVQGAPDWTIADGWVDGNLRAGLAPVALLDNVPAWTADLGSEKFADAWAGYCTAVATRYAGRVRHWEIGNECDSDGYWMAHDPAGMGRLWRIAQDAILAVDPDAFIVCGSFQSIPPTGYACRYIVEAVQAFGGVPMALSVHAYPQDAESILAVSLWLQQVRGALRSVGAQAAQLWVTEWGVWGFASWPEAKQGAFLRAMLTQLHAAGVDVSMHHQFDDHYYGFDDQKVGARIWNVAVLAAGKSMAATMSATRKGVG